MSWVPNSGTLSDREWIMQLADRLESRLFGFRYDAERLRSIGDDLDDCCRHDHEIESRVNAPVTPTR